MIVLKFLLITMKIQLTGPAGPPGELPLLPPDILFQRDAPASRYTRHKRGADVSFKITI